MYQYTNDSSMAQIININSRIETLTQTKKLIFDTAGIMMLVYIVLSANYKTGEHEAKVKEAYSLKSKLVGCHDIEEAYAVLANEGYIREMPSKLITNNINDVLNAILGDTV